MNMRSRLVMKELNDTTAKANALGYVRTAASSVSWLKKAFGAKSDMSESKAVNALKGKSKIKHREESNVGLFLLLMAPVGKL